MSNHVPQALDSLSNRCGPFLSSRMPDRRRMQASDSPLQESDSSLAKACKLIRSLGNSGMPAFQWGAIFRVLPMFGYKCTRNVEDLKHFLLNITHSFVFFAITISYLHGKASRCRAA